MNSIAATLGAQIIGTNEPMHGRTSLVEHDATGLFFGLPNPLAVCRYHSLVAEEASLPEVLEVTARAADGTIMALAHRTRPVYGVQFHPESVLTDHGYALLANLLRLAKLPLADYVPTLADELMTVEMKEVILPKTPVTI